MTLRFILSDGSGVQSLAATFGAVIQTNVIQTAADAAAAAASASAAATSAAGALTSANNAAASAAAALVSQNAAAASQSAAATSATNAANSATSASSSATAAGNSATAAATSATNAANSATAAAQSAADAAQAVNGELTKNVATADYTLTAPDAKNGIFVFTGALTGNRIVTFPAAPKNFTVWNNTTGNFTLTIKAQGQTPSATIVQGKKATLFTDASGCYATSASAGLQFGGIVPAPGALTLDLTTLGNMVVQTAAGNITFPLANSYPAGSGFGYTNNIGSAGNLVLQGSDTADATFPYATQDKDIFYWYSDGVSKWKLGWYTNKTNFKVDGSLVFADGTVQTTAQGLTAATEVRYTVGPTDTVGSFAAGDTALRTAGFVSPYVEVYIDGAMLYRGIHYTLNADGVHINLVDPLIQDADVLVKTRFPFNPSTVYSPVVVPLTGTSGLSTLPFPHVQGSAFLMMNGALLEPGDYTDDANNFYLTAAAGAERYSVLNMNPLTLATALAKSANLSDLNNKATSRSNLGVGRTLLKTVTVTNGSSFQLTDADFGGYDVITIEAVAVSLSAVGVSLNWQAGPNTNGSGVITSGSYYNTLLFSYSNADNTHGITESTTRGDTFGKWMYAPTGTGNVVNGSGKVSFHNMLGLSVLGAEAFGECYCLDNAGSILNGRSGHFIQAISAVIKYFTFFPTSGTFSGKFLVYGHNNS